MNYSSYYDQARDEEINVEEITHLGIMNNAAGYFFLGRINLNPNV